MLSKSYDNSPFASGGNTSVLLDLIVEGGTFELCCGTGLNDWLADSSARFPLDAAGDEEADGPFGPFDGIGVCLP